MDAREARRLGLTGRKRRINGFGQIVYVAPPVADRGIGRVLDKARSGRNERTILRGPMRGKKVTLNPRVQLPSGPIEDRGPLAGPSAKNRNRERVLRKMGGRMFELQQKLIRLRREFNGLTE